MEIIENWKSLQVKYVDIMNGIKTKLKRWVRGTASLIFTEFVLLGGIQTLETPQRVS